MLAKLQTVNQPGAEPIVSLFVDDADMDGVIRFFIDDLQHRVNDLIDAFESGDWKRLSAIAQQLKDAAGGYGYPEMTESAAGLEKELNANPRNANGIRNQTGELVALCRRAILGAASTSNRRESTPHDAIRTPQ